MRTYLPTRLLPKAHTLTEWALKSFADAPSWYCFTCGCWRMQKECGKCLLPSSDEVVRIEIVDHIIIEVEGL